MMIGVGWFPRDLYCCAVGPLPRLTPGGDEPRPYKGFASGEVRCRLAGAF